MKMNADTVDETEGGGTRFRQVRTCFVREDHECGKYLGASKTCFIACPDDQSVKMVLGLVGANLEKRGIDPFVAVQRRAYGQDIFCTKICGRIIESQFCIVILDDVPKVLDEESGKAVPVPNPNVYYGYGMMTALGKHVIPLQKKEGKLAFNIQSHDTVKYTPDNLSQELDVAIKDALSRPAGAPEPAPSSLAMEAARVDKLFELAGYDEDSHAGRHMVRDYLTDTVFRAYERNSPHRVVLYATAHDATQVSGVLTDMVLVSRRLGAELEDALSVPDDLVDPQSVRARHARWMQNACFAVALTGEAADMGPRLKEEFEKASSGPHRFKLYVTSGDEITIGTEKISLSLPKLT